MGNNIEIKNIDILENILRQKYLIVYFSTRIIIYIIIDNIEILANI